MKLRNGFVSNSSSTSFTFCFKGNKIETLYNMILKYRRYFDLSFSGWDEYAYTCNASDIVKSIEGLMKNNEKAEWDKIEIMTINDLIEVNKKDIKEMDREIAESKKEKKICGYDSTKWKMEIKQHYADKIETLNRIKKQGPDHAVIIGFGDNDGNISGGDVGNAMDYEGRNIHISEKDFAVFTEQNR